LNEGIGESSSIWGRISTLASLAGHISQSELFEALKKNNSHAALLGITQVFTANLSLQEHTSDCISGLLAVLEHENFSNNIIREIDECFKHNKITLIPRDFAFAFIEALPASTSEFDFQGFLKWLGYESCRNPLSVLELTEALVQKLETINASQLWQTQPLISALNAILREADQTDEPQLIQRTINLQDRFLRLGVRGMEELLDSAGQD